MLINPFYRSNLTVVARSSRHRVLRVSGWAPTGSAGQSALPPVPSGVAATLSSAAKFAAVVETATLNELDLGAYCRQKGLSTEQLTESCR